LLSAITYSHTLIISPLPPFVPLSKKRKPGIASVFKITKYLSNGLYRPHRSCLAKTYKWSIYPYMNEYTTFTIDYYWVNSEGKIVIINNYSVSETIPTGQMNQTTEKDYPYTVGTPENPPATGTYYCKANWRSKTETGNGVFILVRGKLPLRIT
uniref:NFAM1 Ig-like domain-containing protein n=1 Tax=Gopherus evgoodei TaxID=1825980 RepID=A0A8C4VFC3_9SAUR